MSRLTPYEQVFHQSPVGLILGDLGGNWTVVNRRACELLSLTPEEALARGFAQDKAEPEPFPSVEQLQGLLDGSVDNITSDLRLLQKDGSIRWCKVTVSLIFDRRRRPLSVIAVLDDISDRVELEEALRESEEKFRNIIDTTLEGVWFFDAQGATTFVNQRLCSMLGTPPAAMLGRSILEFTDASDHSVLLESMARRREGISESYELKIRHASGSYFWSQISSSALRDEQGLISGSFSLITDISDRKEAQEDMERHSALLEEKVLRRTLELEKRAREEKFLSNLARELKSQLDPRELTNFVVRGLQAVTHADLVAVVVRAESSDPDRVRYGEVSPLIKAGPADGKSPLTTAPPGEGALEVWAVEGEVPEPLRPWLMASEGSHEMGALADMTASTVPLYFDGDAEIEPALALPVQRARLASLAVIPFTVKGIGMGALIVARLQRPIPWMDETRKLFEATTYTLSVSLDQSYFLLELSRSLEEQRRLARQAQAIAQISTATVTSDSPEDVARIVYDIMAGVMNLSGGALFLKDELGVAALVRFGAPSFDGSPATGPISSLGPGTALKKAAPEWGSVPEDRVESQAFRSTEFGVTRCDVFPGSDGRSVLDEEDTGAPDSGAAPAVARCYMSFAGHVPHSTLLLMVQRPANPSNWTRDECTLFEAGCRSISVTAERKLHLHRIETLALTDALTGLNNRRAFDLDLEAEIRRASRHSDCVTLLFLDLDGLKAVNDEFGHPKGDLLLCRFAAALKASFRLEDRLYRLGGDEFAALLVQAEEGGGPTILDRIRHSVSLVREAGFPSIDVSAGMASFPGEARTLADLVRLSDRRMYEEKTLHRRQRLIPHPVVSG